MQKIDHTQINNSRYSRLRRIGKVLLEFALGQGAVQCISVLIGLFLVRGLSIADYAMYGMAVGFQNTTSALMDLGFTSTIIPLVGDRFQERALVGRYVRAAKAHRDRAFWFMAPLAAAGFLFVTHRQGWSWPIQIGLLLSVQLALFSSGPASYYATPLILYRRLRAYYAPQSLSGICRLGIYILLKFLGALNAFTASVLNAINITVNGHLFRSQSQQSIEWPKADDRHTEKEIFNYILPASPAIILGAFHGQIALFLIGIFGNTVNIAQVAALNRLAQLFSVMMTFNVVVVEPYIARLQQDVLFPTYLKLIGFALLACTALTLFSFAAPGIFLWPLGPQYANLRHLIGWVILTACINYIAGLIWIMNRSRKWIFWRGSILEILLLAIMQIGFAVIFGVRTTRAAVMFNFATSFCYLFTHTYIAIYGFHKISAEM